MSIFKDFFSEGDEDTINETLEEVQSTLSKRDREIEQLKRSRKE